MGNFSVDPEEVRIHARTISNAVAEDYADIADGLTRDSAIDLPGFGIALSPLEAAYIQKVDFLIKDVRGAEDLCRQIGKGLNTVADQFEKAEDLHVTGFGGTPVPQMGYGDAYGKTGVGQVFDDPGALVTTATVITVAEIAAIMASMSAAAALCPSFIPGVAAAALFVANIPDIASTAAALTRHGDNIQKAANTNFDKICATAAATWKGEGRDAFVMMTTDMKAHLDELGAYIRTLGEALQSLAIALVGLWIALAAMVGPFLVWLIAARAAQLVTGPGAAAIEAAIEGSGAAMTGSVATTVAATAAIGGLVLALMQGLGKDFLKLFALPDDGTAGTPDLTEFRVGENFA